jgi:hypothetical protein
LTRKVVGVFCAFFVRRFSRDVQHSMRFIPLAEWNNGMEWNGMEC